jgi:hypothetical protein
MGQEIRAKKGSFGVDTKRKIIVWNIDNLDSITSQKKIPQTIYFGDRFKLTQDSNAWSYQKPLEVLGNGSAYSLHLTKLPLVHISIDTSQINSRKKISGEFSYFGNGKMVKSYMGVRYRGNISLTFPKKSFDIEFWTDSVNKTPKDVKFKGMRSDDDWILDGLYNEPLKLRSTIAAKLWTKMYKPHYLDKEPKAKGGFDVGYVEVFRNNEYYGLYALSESVDRKLLKLRRNNGKSVLGELFKAESYEGAPEFKKAPEYNNLFPHWGGFRMEYPLIDYRAHWDDLSKVVTLTVNGSDTDFSAQIPSKLYMGNIIDYYLFVNMLRATDNLGKNYYIGRYNTGEPYFFIPWDLDGVWGIIQRGKRIPTTNDLLSNGLFDRLLEINPSDFRQKLKSRWKLLRQTHLANSKLFERIDKIYNKFSDEKIYDREQLIWPNSTSNEDHYLYLEDWLKKRLIYLDAHFESL